MKRLLARLTLLGCALVFVGIVVPATVAAHAGERHSTEREAQLHESTTATAREKAQARLNEAQKKTCQNRVNNIEAIMARSVKRAENFGYFFATTSERVKFFVENQDQPVDPKLIDALDQAEAQFRTDLATLKEKAVFSCDSDNPKEQITAFQQANRTVMQDLKDWRAALKNLIEPFKTSVTEESP